MAEDNIQPGEEQEGLEAAGDETAVDQVEQSYQCAGDDSLVAVDAAVVDGVPQNDIDVGTDVGRQLAPHVSPRLSGCPGDELDGTATLQQFSGGHRCHTRCTVAAIEIEKGVRGHQSLAMEQCLGDEGPVFHKRHLGRKTDAVVGNQSPREEIAPAITLLHFGQAHDGLLATHPLHRAGAAPVIAACGLLGHLRMGCFHHLGLGLQSQLQDSGKAASDQHVIGIDKGDIIARCRLQRPVAGTSHSLVLLTQKLLVNQKFLIY